MRAEGIKDSVWKRSKQTLPVWDYKYILYETDNNGITTVTLNRPEKMNAFNHEMKAELLDALSSRFNGAENEKALIITGAGNRAFSTGEDISDIDVDADNITLELYVKNTLELYHEIIRSILCSPKPIIAGLNGTAAGSGLSIAIACDKRFAGMSGAYGKTYYLVPAFQDMGLIPDCGITSTLPKVLTGNSRSALEWFEPGFRISTIAAFNLGVVNCTVSGSSFSTNDVKVFIQQKIFTRSPIEYALTKERRNSAILEELRKPQFGTFDWEIRAQTCCMLSDYTRRKIKEFQNKAKPPAST